MKDFDYQIEMRDIEKSFGAVKPLQGVDLKLEKGECLGLLGDNGAGKSTLMKILSGVIMPDKGTFYFEGEATRISNPREAKNIKIETVFQDLALCDTLSVASNMFLGREPLKSGRLIDQKKLHQQARNELDKLGINIASTKLQVQNMSGGQRQAVAIARAMIFQPKVLIMDEPTAALGVKEVKMVLDLINTVKAQGVSVILITHRLQDLFEVCDRLMVLHEGKCIDDRGIDQFTLESVVQSIMGNPQEVSMV
ncbi:ATP-binding cassette domain-containing protein [Alteribacillus bidgolensis]|uniref:Monosaccharide ABC transporter ATP-binding protein, CUT2 family n=1 Tax=Alteribacillus bidgolensis TaxID=930129 RepID=A0A1G8E6C5_9BACI|nr:ATP-binding cassette domain-containing protein [Alteribacillus bidgolensis]SDH65508.1 monosaccharide ABC transporter ATP-binding protein, CUT2 family [Alteribacillus bidgolensis]